MAAASPADADRHLNSSATSATAAGFALGGTVGIGTFAFALGVGPAVELAFALLARSPLGSG